MDKINICLIIFIFLCIGCKNDLPSNESDGDLDIVKIDFSTNLEEINITDIISPDYKIVSLETNDESLIGNVQKVLISENYLFVLDMLTSRSIFVFSKEGKYIRRIGEKGDGPSEINSPIDFFIEGGRIYVLDQGLIMKIFNFEGEFLELTRMKSPFPMNFHKIPNSPFFCLVGGGTENNLRIVDENFNTIKSYFPYLSRDNDMLIIKSLYTIKANESLIYRRNLNDTLFIVDIKGDLMPYRYFDFGNKSTRYSNLDSRKDSGQEFYNRLANYAYTVYYFETESYGFLGFFFNNQLWTFIHSKSSGLSKLVKRNSLVNDITFENDSYPIAVDGEYLLFLVEPRNLIKTYENLSINGLKGNSYIRKELEKLDTDSNPMLLFIKFNF